MNNAEFIVDDKQVLDMFKEFDSKERKAVFRNAIRNALNIIKKQTLANLKTVINPTMMRKKDKWGNSFANGVTVKVYKGNKQGVIHIMKNFKLKWFETGTEERKVKTFRGKTLKKQRRTGKIDASHFFKRARDAKESEALQSIDRLLSESVRKINDKHKGK